MDIAIVILALAVAVVVIVYFIRQSRPSGDLLEYLRTTNRRLEEQNRGFNERLDNATRVISAVQRNVGEMSEIGRGMKDLAEFLQSPKLRGNVGEQVLKTMLGQYLPKSAFNLQYTFRSGEKVDAAITTKGGIIPIDSKFPMENFRRMLDGDKLAAREFERDVKKHIDAISQKYILPDEGTIDYALMYVPSEAVYYDVVNNQNLFDYAGSKRVLPVSPTTFYAYLKAILMSFEGQKIEEEAKKILTSLRAVHKDYLKVQSNLEILQKHLTNAFNMLGNVTSGFMALGQKITNTQSLEEGNKKPI